VKQLVNMVFEVCL